VVESQIATSGNAVSLTVQLTDLTTKLATNIKLDQARAGQTSTAVSFTCP
jgi:hypothetical protein